MELFYIGVDISKLKFDVCLLLKNKHRYDEFPNTPKGYKKFLRWIQKYTQSSCHVCLEATGHYSEGLAEFLYESKILLSVENPFKIKSFSGSQLRRNKTDKADAKKIALYCKTMNPAPWKPKPQSIKDLKSLTRYSQSLSEHITAKKNQLESAKSQFVADSIQRSIDHLEEERKAILNEIKNVINADDKLQKQNELLLTIPGIGEKASAAALAIIHDPNEFVSAKQFAAYVGVTPIIFESGTSVYKKSRVSKMGCPHFRRAIYMPTLTAIKHNPVVANFVKGLDKTDLTHLQKVCAAMRKLCHIIYGVLKNECAFDPAICAAK